MPTVIMEKQSSQGDLEKESSTSDQSTLEELRYFTGIE